MNGRGLQGRTRCDESEEMRLPLTISLPLVIERILCAPHTNNLTYAQIRNSVYVNLGVYRSNPRLAVSSPLTLFHTLSHEVVKEWSSVSTGDLMPLLVLTIRCVGCRTVKVISPWAISRVWTLAWNQHQSLTYRSNVCQIPTLPADHA